MFPSRLKLSSYALVVLIGCLIAASNLFTAQQLKFLPSWLPTPQVTLGLDLKGGSHLVLAVDAAGLEQDRLESMAGSARAALREAGVSGGRVTVSDAAVVVRTDAAKSAAAEDVLRGLAAAAS